MKIFLKIIKYILICILTIIILFLAFVGISKLFLYDKNSFDVPEHFFDSRFEGKDSNSLQNGYKLFEEIRKEVNENSEFKKVGKLYYYILNNEEYYKKLELNYLSEGKKITKMQIKILKLKRIKELREQVQKINGKLGKLYKKEFIKIKKTENNIIPSPLVSFDFLRTNFYIADYYFKKGDVETGIKLIKNSQKYLEFLGKKYDFSYGLLDGRIYITGEKLILEYIAGTIGKYNFSEKQKNELLQLAKTKIDFSIIKILYKSQYMQNKILSSVAHAKASRFKTLLFFNLADSAAIDQKQIYDLLSGKTDIFIPRYNISNFMGRGMLGLHEAKVTVSVYKKTIEQFEETEKLRQEILNKLQ